MANTAQSSPREPAGNFAKTDFHSKSATPRVRVSAANMVNARGSPIACRHGDETHEFPLAGSASSAPLPRALPRAKITKSDQGGDDTGMVAVRPIGLTND